MNTIPRHPTRSEYIETATECAKGAITGYLLGGGAVTVGAAFAFVRGISAVGQGLFINQSLLLKKHLKNDWDVSCDPILAYTLKMSTAALLLKALGLNSAKMTWMSAASILKAIALSTIIRQLSTEESRAGLQDGPYSVATCVTNGAKGLIAAQMLGVKALPLTLILGFNPANNRNEQSNSAHYQSYVRAKKDDLTFFCCVDLAAHTIGTGLLPAYKFSAKILNDIWDATLKEATPKEKEALDLIAERFTKIKHATAAILLIFLFKKIIKDSF